MGNDIVLTFATGMAAVLVLGYAAHRLGLSPVVGFLLAGVAVGPHTPGFTANQQVAEQFAEMGIILLMFGVGLKFHLHELFAVWRISVPGALLTSLLTTLLTWVGLAAIGVAPNEALVAGLAISVASTVVLMRVLAENRYLSTRAGHIAVGWVVVEDLLTVLLLVALPVLAQEGTGDLGRLAGPLVLAAAKVAVCATLAILLGGRVIPCMLAKVSATKSRELFTLATLALAPGMALLAAKFFGVSMALGAFLAGLVVGRSQFSARAAAEALPLRDAFAVLFFVSVGMLFDPAVVVEQPLRLLAVVLIIVVGKTLAAVMLVLMFRYSLETALIVGASLAQIGEFSFILAGLGVSLKLLPVEGQSLVLAGALISIGLNSALFSAMAPLRQWLLARSDLARQMDLRDDPLAQLPPSTDEQLLRQQVVLVGYGTTGQHIAQALREQGTPVVVVDHRRDAVQTLREQGLAAVSGDATLPETLVQAHIVHAAMLVITSRDSAQSRRMVDIARTLNPGVQVILRGEEDEASLLETETGGTVIVDARERAHGMARVVCQRMNSDAG